MYYCNKVGLEFANKNIPGNKLWYDNCQCMLCLTGFQTFKLCSTIVICCDSETAALAEDSAYVICQEDSSLYLE